MSITKFIKYVCVQTAVYWGNPVNDGYGRLVYDSPIEIKCRWEDEQKIVAGGNGVEQTSVSNVLVTQNLDVQGMLYLGILNDLDSDQNPNDLTGAYQIIAKSVVPLFRSTTEFVHTVYLGYQNRTNTL